MTNAPLLTKYSHLKAAILGSVDLEEEREDFDPIDAVILFPFLAAFACLYGVLSFSVLLTATSIVAVVSSTRLNETAIRTLFNAVALGWASWWVLAMTAEGTSSAKALMSTFMVMIMFLHLKPASRMFLTVSTLIGFAALFASSRGYLLGLWMLSRTSFAAVPSAYVEFNYTLHLTIAISFFIFEADLITRRWSSSQITAKAEVQYARSVKDQLTVEKKGAVTTAVNRLFVKAFGNYDVFSREVAKLVREVKSNLPKDSLELLNSKEVDFSAFELERKLASGGFCTVFRGKWKAGNRQCAVKSFSSADRLDAAGLRGLVNEVVVLTTLNHNHIIRVLGYCWQPQVCLVMEYMAKGTLHDMLAYKSLAISWESPLLSLAIQIADAIAYLHNRNPPIIHRDIKARNILMKDFRTCKLADFGLMVEEGSHQARAGTLRYVAPEVVNRADDSQQNTARADMWSFGVCLWEMATRAQFSGLPPSYMLFSHTPRTLFVSKLPYSIPNVVYDVIEACLQPDPEHRTLTAKEAYSRMRATLGTLDNEDSWFNDDDLPKVNLAMVETNSNFPPEDLSVDASMSWRADAIWRQKEAGIGGAADAVDTSKTIEDLKPILAKGITIRLAKAEKNSRQLMTLDKIAEELPPLPAQVQDLPVYERLGILSRLAEADKSTRIELETKVKTSSIASLPEQVSCRLLEEDFARIPEVDNDQITTEKGEGQDLVLKADASTRLGLLSRLDLAENRTQEEAHSKFSSPVPIMPLIRGSRLLDSFKDEAEVKVTLEPDGEIDMYSRLGLMARLADAETMATHELVEKVVSQRTLDASCPLLHVGFAPLPPDSDEDHDEEGSTSARSNNGDHLSSTSSLESRFIARLGEASSSLCGGASSGDDRSPSSSLTLESRFLSRLKGGSNDSLPTAPHSAPLPTSPFESRLIGRLGSSADVLPTDRTQTSMESPNQPPVAHAEAGEVAAISSLFARNRAAKMDATAAVLPSVKSANDETAQLSALFARKRDTVGAPVNEGSAWTTPTDGEGSNNAYGSEVGRTSPALAGPAMQSFLSRIALAESHAVEEIANKVKAGETTVSCSLLSFPMDEREEEEGDDVEDDAKAPPDAQPGEIQHGSKEHPQPFSLLTTKPQDLLARLANAEASAVAELKSRVQSGAVTVSSSLLSFPMDEVDEEAEQESEEHEVEVDDRAGASATGVMKETVEQDQSQEGSSSAVKAVVSEDEIAAEMKPTEAEESHAPIRGLSSSLMTTSAPVEDSLLEPPSTSSMKRSQSQDVFVSSRLSPLPSHSTPVRQARAQTYQSPLERLVMSPTGLGDGVQRSPTPSPRMTRTPSPMFSDKSKQVQNLVLFGTEDLLLKSKRESEPKKQ